MKITLVGHATLFLEIKGKKILVDPFYTSNPQTTVDPSTVVADYILLTHGHFDHVEDAVTIAKNTGRNCGRQF